MLFKVLKEAARSLRPGRDAAADAAAAEYPLEVEQKLNRVHGRAPLDRHLDILFRDARVGQERFVELYFRCLERTGTAVTPFNVFQRFQTRWTLVQYLLATLAVPGARAECGAYRGATALLLCHALRSGSPAFRGSDFHLIDSFSGTSASVEHDLIAVRGTDGATRREAFFPAGKTDVTVDEVRGRFAEFPEAAIHAGWVPQVFQSLPERDWAFVHLDLTLYEPTLAALEYFYPRLAAGGAVLCDGSIFCPGAEKAWEDYCARHDVPWVVLGHREYVALKPG